MNSRLILSPKILFCVVFFQKLQNGTVREMGALGAKLDEVELLEDSVINEGVEALGDHCTHVSTWAEKIGQETGAQSESVTEFWETIYLQDRPTGATPQRKPYVYPRQLTATSPHEKLIGRYLDRVKNNDKNQNDPNETFWKFYLQSHTLSLLCKCSGYFSIFLLPSRQHLLRLQNSWIIVSLLFLILIHP